MSTKALIGILLAGTVAGLVGLGTWMFLGNLVMRKMIDMRI